MKSLDTLPIEVLINIFSHIIEAPDNVCQQTSYVETYDSFFPSSVLLINRRLREAVFSTIAASRVWVELKCDHENINTMIKQSAWDAIWFYCVPEDLLSGLPEKRSIIEVEISSNGTLTKSAVTYVFPYHLQAFAHLPYLLQPPATDLADPIAFVVDCSKTPASFKPVVDCEISPTLESLRWMYEVQCEGLVFRNSFAFDKEKQADHVLARYAHEYAEDTLRHFNNLAGSCDLGGDSSMSLKRRELDAAAFLIIDRYQWISQMQYRLMPSYATLVDRLRKSSWHSDETLHALIGLNKARHTIEMVCWWAAIHLAFACTKSWTDNHHFMLSLSGKWWPSVPSEDQMLLGLSDQDLVDRLLVDAELSLLETDRLVTPWRTVPKAQRIDNAAACLIEAFSLSQDPEHERYFLSLLSFAPNQDRTFYEELVERHHYVDVDGKTREFVGTQGLWQDLENAIDVMPRARTLATECKEVDKACELLCNLKQMQQDILTGARMKLE